MFDFVKYDTFEVKDIPVMKYGRHFRLQDGAKFVVGRDKDDNAHLEAIENNKYFHIKTVGIPGPHALLTKSATAEDKAFATRAILTYTKAKPEDSFIVALDGEEVTASAFDSRDVMKPFTIK